MLSYSGSKDSTSAREASCKGPHLHLPSALHGHDSEEVCEAEDERECPGGDGDGLERGCVLGLRVWGVEGGNRDGSVSLGIGGTVPSRSLSLGHGACCASVGWSVVLWGATSLSTVVVVWVQTWMSARGGGMEGGAVGSHLLALVPCRFARRVVELPLVLLLRRRAQGIIASRAKDAHKHTDSTRQ